MGVVQLDVQAQPLQHGFLRAVLPLIAGRGGVQRRDGGPDVPDTVGQTARGVVAPGVVAIANPKEGCDLGITRDALIDVAIRDRIDAGEASGNRSI